jgi:hypothetical protein
VKYKSVLIVTYGRSGSTLLQGLLNKIEGVQLNGENHDFCYGLFLAWKSLHRVRSGVNHDKDDVSTNPWYGARNIDPDAFLSGLKPLVREQLLGIGGAHDEDVVYGFKEIRYIHHLDELYEYLQFLSAIFPNPAFVFNIRSHDDVMKSGWWKKADPEQTRALLQRADDVFVLYTQKHPNAHLVRYDEIVKGGDEIDRLLRFLSAEIPQPVIQDTLNTIHSYDVSQAVREKCQTHDELKAITARFKKWVLHQP